MGSSLEIRRVAGHHCLGAGHDSSGAGEKISGVGGHISGFGSYFCGVGRHISGVENHFRGVGRHFRGQENSFRGSGGLYRGLKSSSGGVDNDLRGLGRDFGGHENCFRGHEYSSGGQENDFPGPVSGALSLDNKKSPPLCPFGYKKIAARSPQNATRSCENAAGPCFIGQLRKICPRRTEGEHTDTDSARRCGRERGWDCRVPRPAVFGASGVPAPRAEDGGWWHNQ
jgi:hypothetical protein